MSGRLHVADAKTMDNKNQLIRWKQAKHIDLVLLPDFVGGSDQKERHCPMK
jgi:hypothetical protein